MWHALQWGRSLGNTIAGGLYRAAWSRRRTRRARPPRRWASLRVTPLEDRTLMSVYYGNPTNYKTFLPELKPGDTLQLAAGNYGPLQLSNLHGASGSWITITGPSSGTPAVIQGASGYNTVEISDCTFLAIEDLTINSMGIAGAHGISAKGGFSNLTHDILIQGNTIKGVGGDQMTDGISTKTPTWNWTIRGNTILNPGTGLYLGNSDGSSQFIHGRIEDNLIEGSIGYDGEVKYQLARLTTDANYAPYYAAGMPTGPSTTVIDNNVFIHGDQAAPYGAQPNFLVGGFPSSGPGSQDMYDIYGNLFDHDNTEALLQASGRVAIHDNVFVDSATRAIALQDQNLPLQTAYVYNNTIYGVPTGIYVSSTHAPDVRILGNLVFAATPFQGVTPAAGTNITDTVANAGRYVNNPSTALGSMNFYPKAGQATGAALDLSAFASEEGYAVDFNGTPKGTFTYRGAYAGSGTNPGWQLQAAIKPITVSPPPVSPTTSTWTGAGPDANWSDPLNWAGGLAPQAGNTLVFGPGATQLTTNNDLAAGTSFSAIDFTGSGYTLNGNAITLTNTVSAASATGANTLNLGLTLPAKETLQASNGAAALTLGGAVSVTGSGLTVAGGNAAVTVSGVVSGSGGLTDTASGVLTLSGADTYAGGTTLGGGTLALGNGSALGKGTLIINGGTLQATGGPVTVTNPVAVAANVTLGGSNALTLAGPVALSGTHYLTVTDTGGVTFSGVVGQSSGTSGFIKWGSGQLVLSGQNTYAGNTTLSLGTLTLANASALGTGTLVLNGGTLQAAGGPLTVANPVTVAAATTVGGSTNLALSGAVTLTGNRTLTVNNTGVTTVSGAIGQSGGAYGLTVAGSGLLVLAGSNTYTGPTSVGGNLRVTGTLAGAVTVNSGGTLSGTGTMGTLTVASGGTINRGPSASATGILRTGNLALTSGSTFAAQVNGTAAGTGYDQVSVAGTVNLNSATLSVSLGYTPAVGDSYTLIQNDGTDPVVGTFNGLPEGAKLVLGDMAFTVSYVGGTGNDVTFKRTA